MSIARRVPRSSSKAPPATAWGPARPLGSGPIPTSTAPEPELAIVLGPGHKIFGFTLSNDVSAWDIERENALYLTQSKVYDRCCAIGPVIVTTDEISDPYKLQMTCTVTRRGRCSITARSTPPSSIAAWKPWSNSSRAPTMSPRHRSAHRNGYHRSPVGRAGCRRT